MSYCENMGKRKFLPDDIISETDVAEWIKLHNWKQEPGCALWLGWNEKIYTDSKTGHRFILVNTSQTKTRF